MTDLAERMRELRDRQGLPLADALVRQAARDSIGTVESLGSRFMLAGLPQSTEVLRQLIALREEASRPAPTPRQALPTTQSHPAAQTDPPTPTTSSSPGAPSTGTYGHVPTASPATQTGSWSPPAWYRNPELEDPPVRQIDQPPPADIRMAAPTNTPPSVSPEPAAATRPHAHPATPPATTGPPSWYEILHRTEQENSQAAPDPQVPSATSATSTPRHSARQSAGKPAAQQFTAGSLAEPPSEQNLPDVELLSGASDAFESPDHKLRLRLDQGRVILHWPNEKSKQANTPVFLICASDTAVPETPNDGRRVQATLLNQLVLPAETGRYFAVFAYEVSAIDELATAVGTRHALGRVLTEVNDLQVTAEEHGVLLGWTRPPGIERVRVMRSLPDEPLPSGPDPSLLVPFTGNAFRDTDVEPGATYAYRVYSEARPLGVQDGSWESSTGLVRMVTVPGRPSPVAELSATVEVRYGRAGVTASWQRPSRGDVRLYLAPGEPSVETVVGVAQSAEQFALQEGLLGKRLREPVRSDGGRQSVDWVPLDTEAAGGRHSRWTITAVTEFAGFMIIGAHQVVVHVGDIDELEIDERVDWQLLRSSWPSGASFLGYWVVRPGEPSSGPPLQMITRDDFDEHGGIALRLSPHQQDLLVQGATRYGSRYVTGGQSRVAYPGRWVVRYDLPVVGRFGGARQLQIAVERPDWPDLSFLLVSDNTGFPLKTDAASVNTLVQGQLPGSVLVAGQSVPAATDVKVPRGAATRLLAWSSTGVTPIVVDPLDPLVAPPPLPQRPALRCPRCLKVSDLGEQYFRCQGSCQREPDHAMTQLLHPGTAEPADLVTDRPVFAVVRPSRIERNTQVLDPPLNAAVCPRSGCGQLSHQHVCPHCHSPLPPNWWAHDVLGVVMVGARSAGKTTYLSALMRHLDRNLLPAISGHLHPIDPESETKLHQLRAGLHTGELAAGTPGAAQNAALLRPMLASIGTAPDGRYRSLALFDVAGEDMASAETVRPYSPALTGADLVVVLIDPLQLDGVREWLEGTVPLPAKGAPAVTVLHNVVQEIRRYRGIASGPLPQRAAVAFAKFDGLQEAAKIPQSGVGSLISPSNALWRDPYAFPSALYYQPDGRRVHDEVRSLLLGMGESALVSTVEGAFSEVQYFAVSALGHGPRGRVMTTAGASPQRVGDPLRWLLWLSRWGM